MKLRMTRDNVRILSDIDGVSLKKTPNQLLSNYATTFDVDIYTKDARWFVNELIKESDGIVVVG